MVMVLSYELQKMMSGRPSPSKSPIATPQAFQPVAKSTSGAKELFVKLPGLLVFLKMESWLGSSHATATSGFRSPSRSPNASVCAHAPTAKSTLGAKLFVVMPPAVLVLRKTDIACP